MPSLYLSTSYFQERILKNEKFFGLQNRKKKEETVADDEDVNDEDADQEQAYDLSAGHKDLCILEVCLK